MGTVRLPTAIAFLLIASVSRAELMPLEVKSPKGTSLVVDARPRGARRVEPPPPGWWCATPCTLWLPAGGPYDLRVQRTNAFAGGGKEILLREPAVVTIDPVSNAARNASFGFAIGSTVGLGASAVLLYVASGIDDAGYEARMTVFGALTVGHAFAALIRWALTLHNRTSIEVARKLPEVALTPRSANLGWSF